MEEIEQLTRQAESLRASIKDNSSREEIARIEREHGEVLDRLRAAKTRTGGGPRIRVSADEMSSLLAVGDRSGIRPLVQRWIDEGLDREAIGRRVIDQLGRRDEAEPMRTQVGGGGYLGAASFDNPDFVRRAVEDALFARMTGREPEGAAREFAGRRLEDLRTMIDGATDRRDGRWFDRSGGQHTTSDFPNLLLGAGNRTLQQAYEAASSPLLSLARIRNSTDFRPINVLRLSEAPALEKVGESGEITHGSRGEEREAFSLETFARIFSMSRQALINDDLSAFADFGMAFGRAAAETVAKQLVALFTANSGAGATLEDGDPLFHSSRENIAGTGAAISVDALGAARQALRETKGLDGVTPIGMTPRFLVVGPAKETEAEKILTEILANSTDNADPFSRKIELLVEPRFTGNAWRVFADAGQQQVISVAYLNGGRGPLLQQREGWSTLGFEFRAVLDFGCGITDWRGVYLNPGA